MTTSAGLRELVVERANRCCEYCRTADLVQVGGFEIDHIVPRAKGGQTIEGNLAYACPACNGHKWAHVHASDSATGASVPLFNPRTDVWDEHFAWVETSFGVVEIVGKTPCGRATVERLQMNHPDMLTIRRRLIAFGVLTISGVDS